MSVESAARFRRNRSVRFRMLCELSRAWNFAMGAGMPRKKLSKAAVDYEPRATHADHCGICRHFIRPDGCALVRGPIAAEAWCNRFERHEHRA